MASTATRQTLALPGLAELPLAPPIRPFECPALIGAVDRHTQGDRLVKAWTRFDPLAEDELIVVRADGSELRAQQAGYLVFPYTPALPGHEWFYREATIQRPFYRPQAGVGTTQLSVESTPILKTSQGFLLCLYFTPLSAPTASLPTK